MIAQTDIWRLPLPDESVDLIFTDPPYSKDYLPLYEWLGAEAERILRPSGFLLLMCGGSYLNQVFRALDLSGLEYFWKYEMLMQGKNGGVIRPRGNAKVPIISRSKPIIAYTKDGGFPRTGTLGVWTSSGADKRFHHWGQDVGSARYFIDCFSAEGDLICDPMVGGGTTAVACQLINRRFVGFDLDMEACRTSQDRIMNSDAMVNLPLFKKRRAPPVRR